ncbi:MAG: hypothetical protein GY895_13200 [Phycisphaera sp.]|nr:hypothetical protein [Phycisphaera sp.]
MLEAILEFADVKLRSNYEHSLAEAATEAAVEAKAEIVKHSLLSEATETGGEGAAEGGPNSGGDADAREDRDAKSSLNNRDPRSANHRHRAKSSDADHPSYDNGDESEHPDEDPLDRWFRGDEDGEAA